MVASLNTQRWVYIEMVFTAKKHKSTENIQKYTKIYKTRRNTSATKFKLCTDLVTPA